MLSYPTTRRTPGRTLYVIDIPGKGNTLPVREASLKQSVEKTGSCLELPEIRWLTFPPFFRSSFQTWCCGCSTSTGSCKRSSARRLRSRTSSSKDSSDTLLVHAKRYSPFWGRTTGQLQIAGQVSRTDAQGRAALDAQGPAVRVRAPLREVSRSGMPLGSLKEAVRAPRARPSASSAARACICRFISRWGICVPDGTRSTNKNRWG